MSLNLIVMLWSLCFWLDSSFSCFNCYALYTNSYVMSLVARTLFCLAGHACIFVTFPSLKNVNNHLMYALFKQNMCLIWVNLCTLFKLVHVIVCAE
jgi:hypothetical protein